MADKLRRMEEYHVVLAAIAEIERQANKITELENDIMRMNDECVTKTRKLQAKIDQLTADNKTIAEELESYEREFENLRVELAQERESMDKVGKAAAQVMQGYLNDNALLQQQLSNERERAKVWRDAAKAEHKHASWNYISTEEYQAALAFEGSHEKPPAPVERGPARREIRRHYGDNNLRIGTDRRKETLDETL